MSQPAVDDNTAKPRRTRLYIGVALFAALSAVALIWAAVERVQDAVDHSR